MFGIVKLKKAKNSYGPNGFFFPGPTKISRCFQTTQKYTRFYQRKQNLIQINTNLYSIKQKIN
jgi:hypothetical protein